MLKTHAVNSLFYGHLILQQKWSHMRDGHKRGRCHGQLLAIGNKYSTQIETLKFKLYLNYTVIT